MAASETPASQEAEAFQMPTLDSAGLQIRQGRGGGTRGTAFQAARRWHLTIIRGRCPRLLIVMASSHETLTAQ